MTQQTPQEVVDRLETEYNAWVRQYRTQELDRKVAFMNKDVIKILVRVLGRIMGATNEEIEADLGVSREIRRDENDRA